MSSSSDLSASCLVPLSTKAPLVSMPVLSNTNTSAAARVSSTCPRVLSRPNLVKEPIAAVTAVGVASDKAQGQVTTNTARVISKAREGSCINQKPATKVAITNKPATKYAAI